MFNLKRYVDSKLEEEEVDEFLAEIDEVIALSNGLPDRAFEYAESVEQTLQGIRESVEEKGFVTEGQKSAVQNIRSGCEEWSEYE